nr:hypothetical protein [Acidianus ambivalens]
MARKRKHSILIYGPEGAAKKTVEDLKKKVERAEVEPAVKHEWEDRYFSGIANYATSPERTKAAEEKLTVWYEVLMRSLAPKYAEDAAKAKAEYYRELARKMKKEENPAEEAEEEYENIFKPI